jgi:hypothetical protein
MQELENNEGANRFRENDARRDGHREFEIAVKREQNEKNQKDSKRTYNVELRFRFEKLAVFATPIQSNIGLDTRMQAAVKL